MGSFCHRGRRPSECADISPLIAKAWKSAEGRRFHHPSFGDPSRLTAAAPLPDEREGLLNHFVKLGYSKDRLSVGSFHLLVVCSKNCLRVSSEPVVVIFGDVCTYGLWYSVGWLPDRATDRLAYKSQKCKKFPKSPGFATLIQNQNY